MSRLAIRRYEGTVRLVESADDLELAAADFRHETLVGLDTETRPAFRKGESHLPCLVQVATARAVYLFPLRYRDSIPVLAALLSEARTIKAGVAPAYDLRRLQEVFPFAERSVLDLGIIARRCGLGQAGLRNLAGILLGFRIPKGNRTSNWAAPALSASQINYAATDAWACRELYLRFETLGMMKDG